jgi:hypothetical protein
VSGKSSALRKRSDLRFISMLSCGFGGNYVFQHDCSYALSYLRNGKMVGSE